MHFPAGDAKIHICYDANVILPICLAQVRRCTYAGDKAQAQTAYAVAVKAVDKAAAHGLIHRNNAARKKSGLTLRLNKLEG